MRTTVAGATGTRNDEAEQVSTAVAEAFARPEVVAWVADRQMDEPLHLDDVFPAELAAKIAGALAGAPAWQRVLYVADQDLGTHVRVTPERFDRASRTMTESGDVQYSSAEVLDPMDLAAAPGLEGVYAGLTTCVTSYAARAFGLRLAEKPFVNASRMVAGDFLRAHLDHEDDRLIGLLWYFSPAPWRPGSGGELGYRGRSGDRTLVAPTHNSMSLMRLGRTGVHWVQPVVDEEFARYAIIGHLSSAPPVDGGAERESKSRETKA